MTIKEIVDKYGSKRENLLQILHDIQNQNPRNYINKESISALSKEMNIPVSQIKGTASLVKYAILATTVKFIVDVPDKIAQVMSLPQLFTALSGGVIALLAYKALWVIGIDRTKEVVKDIK